MKLSSFPLRVLVALGLAVAPTACKRYGPPEPLHVCLSVAPLPDPPPDEGTADPPPDASTPVPPDAKPPEPPPDAGTTRGQGRICLSDDQLSGEPVGGATRTDVIARVLAAGLLPHGVATRLRKGPQV